MGRWSVGQALPWRWDFAHVGWGSKWRPGGSTALKFFWFHNMPISWPATFMAGTYWCRDVYESLLRNPNSRLLGSRHQLLPRQWNSCNGNIGVTTTLLLLILYSSRMLHIFSSLRPVFLLYFLLFVPHYPALFRYKCVSIFIRYFFT